jgi:hypothetical protein
VRSVLACGYPTRLCVATTRIVLCADQTLKICEANARAAITANKPTIAAVTRSSLLSRASHFLPTLQAANMALQRTIDQSGAEAVNIEHVSERNGGSGATGDSDTDVDGPERIEMDLACGVLDLEDGAAAAAAKAAAACATSVDDDLAADRAGRAFLGCSSGTDSSGSLLEGDSSSREGDERGGLGEGDSSQTQKAALGPSSKGGVIGTSMLHATGDKGPKKKKRKLVEEVE